MQDSSVSSSKAFRILALSAVEFIAIKVITMKLKAIMPELVTIML